MCEYKGLRCCLERYAKLLNHVVYETNFVYCLFHRLLMTKNQLQRLENKMPVAKRTVERDVTELLECRNSIKKCLHINVDLISR
jgi:hypothetical protein